MFRTLDSSERLSTNEKLNRILHGRDDDEDDKEKKRKKEQRAKQRLARSVLYGTGVRGILPTVKKEKATATSHFFLSKPDHSHAPLVNETISIPPGAHEDQYRMVKNITSANMADPDKLLYTSTSMTAGVRHVAQPPWYVGNQNKVKPPDDSIMTAAARYGFRGSKKIRQYETEAFMSPIRTRTEHTPKFLVTEPVLDEWVPPLQSAALNNGFLLTTPKLWPENSVYATGYPNKQLPTSSIYIKETTVATGIRPVTTKSMDYIEGMLLDEESQLLNNSRLELTRSLLSRPMTEQAEFRHTWEDRMSKTLNATHPTFRTTTASNKNRSDSLLMDPTDKFHQKQSSGTAVLVHTQSSDVLKYKSRLMQSQSLLPYKLRWTQIYDLVNAMKGKLRLNQKLGDVIRDLTMKLHVDSMSNFNGEEDTITRPRFLEVLTSLDHLNGIPNSQINLLYSAFDYIQSNSVRLVDIASSFMVLDVSAISKASESAIMKKLTSLWFLYDTFSHRLTRLETCLAILTSAAASDEDRQKITILFKEKFRPKCYSLAVMREPIEPSTFGTKDSPNMSSSQNLQNRVDKPQKQGANTPFPYNVCDSNFDCDLFVEVLEACPELTAEFERQMHSRLSECYGNEWG